MLCKSRENEMKKDLIQDLITRSEAMIEFVKTELASLEVDVPPQTPNTKGE